MTSKTDNRKRLPLPSKSVIARCWASQETKGNPLVEKIHRSVSWDWGEPSCWACGLTPLTAMSGQSADEIDYRGSREDLFTCWNRAKFLERCHIVPDSRGGSNKPENLLLLCKSCHREAPDSMNPVFMTKYVTNRASRFLEELNLVEKMIETYGITKEEMDKMFRYSQDNKEQYDEYIHECTLIGSCRGGVHRSKKIAEGIAAIIDFYYKHCENAE